MKSVILFSLCTLLAAQIDTTYISCPPAGFGNEYEYSGFTFSPEGDGELLTISQPDWLSSTFEQMVDDSIAVVLSGIPDPVDEGLNTVVIGWYAWNDAIGQEALSQVFIFTIVVEESCCGDPTACNFDPGGCITIGNYCLYDCGCTDPAAFNYDPQAELNNWLCDYCFPGDMNDDGVTDILDLIQIVGGVLENLESPSIDFCRANINGDDHLDISDILLVVETILNDGDQPPILSVSWGAGLPDCALTWEGWCYCESEFTATGTDVSFTNYNYCNAPDVSLAGSISPDSWDEILQFVNREYFLALNANYGLMGDDDSNYEWITIIFEDTTKTVGYTTDIDLWYQLDGLRQLRVEMATLADPFNHQIHCITAPDVGPCDGLCPRYFFNPETEQCEMFYWGCCDGTVPFETLEECQQTCEE